jgi:transmembrane sensor
MAEPQERLLRAAEHVAPGWSPDREERVRNAVQATQRRRARRSRTLAVATAAMLTGALAVFGYHTWSVRSAAKMAASAATTAAPLVRFEDGSVVTALGDTARVAPVEVRARAVGVRLEAGGARFSVAPNPERVFRVMARDVTVTVLGTVFTVAMEPAGVRVAVERGRVHVAWPAGERDLAVGDSALVGDSTAAALAPQGMQVLPPSPDTDDKAAPAADVHAPHAAASAAPTHSWRSLAEEGDYTRAFAKLAAEGPSAVRDDPEDLLLAADVARLGGHPEKAVNWLERVLSAHAGDSRAALAAFTLGRTLLDQLGRPREAAQAFARAERLDPKGTLSQDALAREVESWSRAGDSTLARERAERYSTLYPKGRRLQAVRRLGGLD